MSIDDKESNENKQTLKDLYTEKKVNWFFFFQRKTTTKHIVDK